MFEWNYNKYIQDEWLLLELTKYKAGVLKTIDPAWPYAVILQFYVFHEFMNFFAWSQPNGHNSDVKV
jgi:hypothetical protein